MDLGIAATTYAVVIPAELLDETFVSTVLLGSRDRAAPVWCGAEGPPASVFVGASVAFVLVSGIGVLAGRSAARVVQLARVRRISGVVLAALGAWSAIGAASG